MSRKKEKIKIRVEINEIVPEKIQKIDETKSLFFKKMYKHDKPLIRLIKKNK